METMSLMMVSVALARRDRCSARHLGGAERTRQPVHASGARRDADRPVDRLPGAGRAAVQHRAGPGHRRHGHLRAPAGRPAHGARHPPRAPRHRRGGAHVRVVAASTAHQGAAAASDPVDRHRHQPDDQHGARHRGHRLAGGRRRARRGRARIAPAPRTRARAGHRRRDRLVGARLRPCDTFVHRASDAAAERSVASRPHVARGRR